ncbi:protein Spindly-A-like [Glandiceps talaboti]
MADVEDLEAKVHQLKQELNLEKENVQKAAQIGKHLLEQNEELEIRLESLQKDHVTKLEELEQEKYSLQLKLTARERVERSLIDELEQTKESLQTYKETEMTLRQKETLQTKKIREIEEKNSTLQTDLENGAMMEEQLKEKVKYFEDLVEDIRDKLQKQQNISFNDEELVSLYQQNSTLKAEQDSLSMELKHTKSAVQQMMTTRQSMEQKIDSLKQELEEKEQQSTSYFNALEKSREEVTELEVQLDMIKMQSVNPDSKGNSLFAEVDDRRKDHEKKLITLKVQHDSLKEQYSIKKQQLFKMKGQIAALLQMSSYQADHAQIQRLETALSQSKGQVKLLSEKLQNLTHLQTDVSMTRQMEEFQKEMSDKTPCDTKKFVHFLQQQLQSTKKELCELKEELQTQRLLRIAESDQLWKTEKKLHESESSNEKNRAENMRIHLKLEELRTKYGESEDQSKQSILRGNVEKIPIRSKMAGSSSEKDEKHEDEESETKGKMGDRVTEMDENEVDTDCQQRDEKGEEMGTDSAAVEIDRDECCHGDESQNKEGVDESTWKDKKRVRMNTTVSVLNESGSESQQNIHEDGKDTRTAKRRGKRYQKVIHSKDAVVKNECKQQ